MNIGFNCVTIKPDYCGGVNTFATGLLNGLFNVADEHRIQLYCTENNTDYFHKFREYSNIDIIILRKGVGKEFCNLLVQSSALLGSQNIYKQVSNLIWKNWSRIMDKCSDIIYTPMATLEVYGLAKPTVLSMHDIQHVHFPEFFSRLQLLSRKVRYSLSAEKATYLQASSEFIKKDLLTQFHCLHPENIVVIPEGVSLDIFSTPSCLDVVLKYDLPERYLFFPAQLWPHKNHITVLKALQRLGKNRNMNIPLVLTGAKFSTASQIFSFIQENQMEDVYYLGSVPFEDIVALYQRARFFITATLYESSSLPFLEAAASGCPIIASDTPPNREMSQILKAELFDPEDELQLAHILDRAWDDDELINDHVSHNNTRIVQYSWNNVARRYLEFMEERVLM